MKKSLAMALAASFVMSAAGTVFAADVPNPLDLTFDGSVTLQYRNHGYDNPNKASENGLRTTIVLNAQKNLAKNFDFYSRITYQDINGSNKPSADYVANEYNGAIDAFGFKYSNAGFKYTLGSQALTLGATGIVYDNGFIGKHALPYALSVNGKVGATDLQVFYAKTNYQDVTAFDTSSDNDKFYGIQGTYAINDKAKVGAMFTRVNYNNWYAGQSTTASQDNNYYALNASYQFTDKFGVVGEYAKSNFDTDNKAYMTTASYKLDSQNTVGISAWRVEDYAGIVDKNFGTMTTTQSNAKGLTYKVSHKLGTDTNLSVAYQTYSKIKDTSDTWGASNDRNRTDVNFTINF